MSEFFEEDGKRRTPTELTSAEKQLRLDVEHARLAAQEAQARLDSITQQCTHRAKYAEYDRIINRTLCFCGICKWMFGIL